MAVVAWSVWNASSRAASALAAFRLGCRKPTPSINVYGTEAEMSTSKKRSVACIELSQAAIGDQQTKRLRSLNAEMAFISDLSAASGFASSAGQRSDETG